MMAAGTSKAKFETPDATGSVSIQYGHGGQDRIAVLDGLRGLMTVFVVGSHFFAEVPNGVKGLSVGWIAVLMFFVMSGFLVGRLIAAKQHHVNFFKVFYLRRACRTLPVYVFCVLVITALMRMLGPAPYMEITGDFPLWSYMTFTQNVFMAKTHSVGAYWLAPTWTLSVEEQFYLIAPALMMFTPKRWLPAVLVAAIAGAVAFRAAIAWGGVMSELAGLVYLPGCMDALCCGLLAAMIHARADLTRYATLLRVIPLVMLALIVALRLIDGETGHLFAVFSRLLGSIACAAYLLSIVTGAPEGKRLHSRALHFFGHTSYAVYLLHLTVLGLMHGLILGTAPDLATPVQWAITIAALPVTVALGWLVTKAVEEPITAFGRRFAWSGQPQQMPRPYGVAA